MNRRTTLILVVVFAVLAVFAYYTQQQNPNPLPPSSFTPPATPATIFEFLSDNVASIEVRNLRTNQVTQVKRISGNWIMQLPANSPADTTTVNRVVGTLAHLSSSRVITSATDLSAFGLVTPTFQARLVMTDTTAYALNFGNQNPDKTGYYVNYPGDPRIFIVPVALYQDVADFVDKPPYPPTATPTLLPTFTPTVTPPGGIPTGTPAVTGTPTP